MTVTPFDLLVIGGGIVGLATAYQAQSQYPDLKICLLEKESAVAQHQTGRNSGVIHSGIYYKPGSYKAENCLVGRRMLIDFCDQYHLPYELCGKLIVATDPEELPALEKLYERGLQNGIHCRKLTTEEVLGFEPHVNSVAGLHIPEAGIVDYKQVAEKLRSLIVERGGVMHLGTHVQKLTLNSICKVISQEQTFEARVVLTCAGLQSDRLLQASGIKSPVRIIPFRGEYYQLRESSAHLCRNLIYPVPDPEFPFLGVHLTRMIHGGIECGPNAVLSLSREGYRKGSVNLRDTWDTLKSVGFRRFARKHWRMGAGEFWRSISKHAFTESLRRLVPAITMDDLMPGGAGHRAQAIHENGSLVDDFVYEDCGPLIHLVNAPSPAATASLALGFQLSQLALSKLRS
jgi:L-2-hydroxyglutarate oxidase